MAILNNCILNNQEIDLKIRRIAYQIYESNVNFEDVVLAGIYENGYILAKKIKHELEKITDLKTILCSVKINKKNPEKSITTSLDPFQYKNKSLVLIDDVLNSGTTLIYGVKHFLETPLTQFKTAVLVNRNHKKYPVKADFKGISLSTSLNEHVNVILRDDKSRVDLT